MLSHQRSSRQAGENYPKTGFAMCLVIWSLINLTILVAVCRNARVVVLRGGDTNEGVPAQAPELL